MKFLYSFIAVSIVLAAYFSYKPDQFLLSKNIASNAYNDIFFRKNISVRGLKVLRVDAIKKLLPIEYSNLWWSLNASFIDGVLEKNPFIQGASTEHCGGSILNFSCFIISIEERTPAYISLVGNEASVLGDDGATIQTAKGEDIEKTLQTLLDPKARPPIVLLGLVTPGVSSDITEARFRYLRSSIQMIESEVKLHVQRVELLPTGELSARIQNVPYDIVFDDTSKDNERLHDEVTRLKRLLPELDGKKDRVSRVDLSYNKIAVVSYK